MKHLLVLLVLGIVSLVEANADGPTISVVSAGTVITQMPGSPTDFDIFTVSGDPTAPNASDLTNFSVGFGGPDGGPIASGNTIVASNGDTINTAVDYQGNPGPANITEFTLNSTSDNFNFADFNVFVLIGNFGWTINSMALTQVPNATVPHPTSTPASTPVTDTYEGPTGGQVVEFNISGATAGDEFVLSTTSSINTEYIQGVSFESIPAPEPSTYALMLGAVAFLGLCVRRRLA